MSKLIYPILLIAALSGCASPARIDQMAAKRIDTSRIATETPLKHNLSLRSVSGGESTNPLWISKVSGDDFRKAFEQSLKTTMLLASDQSKSIYLLDAKLISLDQPLFGLDIKVTATVEYSLEEKATGRRVFTKTISTPFTATFSDAAIAVIRVQIANEGAVRENIEKIIDELLSLAVSNTGYTPSVSQKLNDLQNLRKDDVITEDEFQKKKQLLEKR